MGASVRPDGEDVREDLAPAVRLHEQELLDRLGWFIRVRWLFVAGLGFAILAGATAFRIEFPIVETAGVGVAVLAYNVLFLVHHRFVRDRTLPGIRTSRIEACLQIGLDLLALTSLIHLTGGAENPFIGFYLFHAIVGSMLLSRAEAWLVGLAALALFLAVIVLEHELVLPHHHIAAIFDTCRRQHGAFLIAMSLGFVLTVFSTISITSSIVNSLRVREQQLVLTQEALVRKSADLETAYATLTEKQKQLVLSEKQASLGHLVSGIAHEINNPIQFIHGNMAVLSEAFSDALPILDACRETRPGLRIARLDYPFFRQQVPVLLKDMADGAARIAGIVRDLKTFARHDEGALDENVDLNEAVRASVRLLHAQLKHVRVEEDLDPDLPRLKGNVTQLEQVVVNTLENAAHALGRAPGGTIRIRTRTEHTGHRVRLSIEDNGSGIPPDVKDRIFDPFFTTKQRSGGTGLGLSITYGIVQQHRGQIQVDSQLGVGTAFHFLLPVKRSEA